MTSNEARLAILKQLNRTPLADLYKPGTRTTYDAPEIVTILLHHLPDEVRDYYVHTNNLSRASIHASVERALEDRAHYVRTGKARR